MTHRKYAEKVWLDANAAWDSPHDLDQRGQAVAIIAAALQKQRVGCRNAYRLNRRREPWEIEDAIFNAEVEE